MPPRTLTSTKLCRLNSSPKLHRPSGSRESSPTALAYRWLTLTVFFSSPCLTTAHSALGVPPGDATIVPLETSSPTRSSSHFALSLLCSSSNLSLSLRRLRCRSVAHLAIRTSLRRCSPCAVLLYLASEKLPNGSRDSELAREGEDARSGDCRFEG
jgi:hypothetical protein